MKKYCIENLANDKYAALITLLDYEMTLVSALKDIEILNDKSYKKKVIIDLALKSGVSGHRFVEFEIDSSGHLNFKRHQYTQLKGFLLTLANNVLRSHSDIVKNSFLSDFAKRQIL